MTPSQGCEGSSQGRESVFVATPKIKNKSKWIPALLALRARPSGQLRCSLAALAVAGMTKWEAFAGKAQIGRERGAHTKHEHHPHPTLPLKGRA